MFRHSDMWQVTLSTVHLSLNHKEFASKNCKIKLKLPEFLSNEKSAGAKVKM